MRKNLIMRYLAAAFAAVLISTSTIPAYAEVIEETSGVHEEETVQLAGDEFLVEASDDQKEEEVIPSDDLSDAARTAEENAVEDEEETETEAEAEAEADVEMTEEEDEEDGLLNTDDANVARVVTKESSTEYSTLDAAVNAWNEAGAGARGATLVLLADVVTSNSISVAGGNVDSPMILDLNDNGILYKGSDKISVIVVNDNGYLKLTDSAGSKTRYIRTDSYGRATGVYATKKGANNIEVTGGFIAGGTGSGDAEYGGGIYNSGTFIMDGGTICGNRSVGGGGGVYSTGSFKLNGGKICNNSTDSSGGAVLINGGSAEISGGVIKANSANLNGGGISEQNSTSLLISGGLITGNKASGTNSGGGGIYSYVHAVITGGEISNNHAMDGGGVFSLSEFTIAGGKITENEAYDEGGGVYNSGSFTFEGGEITENSALNGGGLFNSATVTMNGGRINDNEVLSFGAGVYNDSDGEFIMNDGDIGDNVADNGGGGVYNLQNFTMNGGRISGNASVNNHGGGIYNDQNFTLFGGEITGNKAMSNKGGGIFSNGYVEMNGGKISLNESKYPGDGLYNNAGSFMMYGGEFANNETSAVHNDDGTVSIKGDAYVSDNNYDKTGKDASKVSSSEVELRINIYTYIFVDPKPHGIAAVTTSSGKVTSYDTFSDALSAWKTAGDGAKLTLLDNVEITDTIIVTAGTERSPMILDLNGYGILYKGDSGNVITINAEKCLELDDTGLKTRRYLTVEGGRGKGIYTDPGSGRVFVEGGYITGGNSNINNGAGGIIIKKSDYGNGTLIMNGGTIVANTSKNGGSNSAGAIFDYGTFIMNGGSIQNNSGTKGGGVYVYYFGSFVMNGGQIYDNTADNYGGGVNNTGSFVLKDGSIIANKILDDSEEFTHGGGGVHTTGDFLMLGGSISENSEESYGGGICINTSKDCKIYGGIINGNLSHGGGRAIYIASGSVNFAGSVFAADRSDGRGAMLIKGETANELYEKVKDKSYITVLGLYVDPDPVPDMVYTGSAIVPNFKVYNGTTLLSSKTDYTVSVKNNTDSGTANYTISGKGNYSFKFEGSFEIVKKNIADADIAIAEIAPKAEGKSAYKPVPSITYNKKKLTANKDFTVTYYNSEGTSKVDNPVTAGHYLARVEGNVNYIGTRDVPFVITSADQIMVSKLTIEKIPDQPYNVGKAIIPSLSVKNGKNIVPRDCYDVKYRDNTDVGTATVTITGKEDKGYIGSKSVTFKITGIVLSKAELDDKDAKKKFVYNGQPQRKDFVLVYKQNRNDRGTTLSGMDKTTYDGLPSGSNAKRSIDYVFAYEDNVNAGTATLFITGINNWSGSIKKTFKIEQFDIKTNEGGKFTVKLAKTSYPYCKAGVKPLPEVKFHDRILQNGVDYTLSYANNTAVGGTKSPVVKVTGKGNFTGANETATFKIGKADLANGITVTANDVVWADKNGNYKTTVTVTDSDGKKLTANTDYILTFSLNESGTPALDKNYKVELPGTTVYAVITCSNNAKCCYEGSTYGTYRVCAKDIGKFNAKVADQIYTGKAVTVTKDDITWKAATSGDCPLSGDFEIVKDSYVKNVNKGTASFIVKGVGGYGGTKKLTFVIKSKDH